jgi:hypothetical protein
MAKRRERDQRRRSKRALVYPDRDSPPQPVTAAREGETAIDAR